MIRILWIFPGMWVSGILYMLVSRYLEMDHAAGFSPVLGIMLTGFFGTIIGLLKVWMRPDASPGGAQALTEEAQVTKVFGDEKDDVAEEGAMISPVTPT
jgi:hypothetical protein